LIIYSRTLQVVLNLIVLAAFYLAFKSMPGRKGRIILLSIAVLVFILPFIFPVVPGEGKWLIFYLAKVGLGIFCLIYVRIFKRT
jgi:hypothetical protein